mmetsp:Transcript_27873/g.84018  ORF Transcript_27873/g.84018 Transcript_27873/m.84018 type:complete len:427 (+) Transcript_27873:361-1641(+)
MYDSQRLASKRDGWSSTPRCSKSCETCVNKSLASTNFRAWYSSKACVCMCTASTFQSSAGGAITSCTFVGSRLPFTATQSTGREGGNWCKRLGVSTLSLISVRVLYRELRPFKRADKLMPSPKSPYFIRLCEPMFPARICPECTPQRQWTTTSCPVPVVTMHLPVTTLWMSWAVRMPASEWCLRTVGVLYTARTSSPMNSRRTPRCFWMQSAMRLNTFDSKFKTSLGDKERQDSSKPAMSAKRMVAWTLATPMVASVPEVYSRSTTQGGTYLDHDLIALRMPLKEFCKSLSSSATLGRAFSDGCSRSMCTSSRHDIAIMSSTSVCRGCSRLPENTFIFTFKTYTKINSRRMTEEICMSAHAACSFSWTDWSTSVALTMSGEHIGSQTHENSASRMGLSSRMRRARATGSSFASGGSRQLPTPSTVS